MLRSSTWLEIGISLPAFLVTSSKGTIDSHESRFELADTDNESGFMPPICTPSATRYSRYVVDAPL